MSILFSLLLQAASPQPITPIQQRDLRCVAALAIIASEQERGALGSERYPWVVDRGRTYAGIVGERVMTESGLSREAVRDLILAAVADQQARVADVADPEQVVEAEMATCLPLLDATVPPKPKPDLVQCAAMLELAYREVHDREGLSSTAKDLKTLAAVLDSRAREKLSAQGMSGTEADIILTQMREEMLAEGHDAETGGTGSDLDYDHCFALAAPKERDRSNPHD